ATCISAEKLETVPSPFALIQRRGRHFLGHSVMQSQYAVTAAGKLQVMGDDKGSKPVLAMKSLHQAEHHFRCPVVQVTRWLICHQDFRSRYQRPGQGHPLLLTAGKLSRAMMTSALQPNFPQPPAGLLHGLSVRGALH